MYRQQWIFDWIKLSQLILLKHRRRVYNGTGITYLSYKLLMLYFSVMLFLSSLEWCVLRKNIIFIIMNLRIHIILRFTIFKPLWSWQTHYVQFGLAKIFLLICFVWIIRTFYCIQNTFISNNHVRPYINFIWLLIYCLIHIAFKQLHVYM